MSGMVIPLEFSLLYRIVLAILFFFLFFHMKLSIGLLEFVNNCVGILLAGWSFTSWSTVCSCSLCLRVALRSQVLAGFGGRVGLVACRVRLTGGVLEQPTWRKLAWWLVSEAEEGGGGAQGFRPGYPGLREWSAHLADWSLTSWSTLCSCSLWFSVQNLK